MNYQFLLQTSENLKNELIKVFEIKNKAGLLQKNRDANRLVKFYCALAEYGPEMLDWELETFEIILSRAGFSHSEIMDIIYIVHIVKNKDYVLTEDNHFEDAVCALNDIEVDVTKTEFQPPHYVVWGIIAILALYGADGFPFIGSTLEYIINDFKHYHWTNPPIFFAKNDFVKNNFPDYFEPYIKEVDSMPVSEFVIMAKTIRTPANGLENYIKSHAPILDYMESKFKETVAQIKKAISEQ